MQIFKLCGFEQTEEQFFSAFNFIRDYEVVMQDFDGESKVWEEKMDLDTTNADGSLPDEKIDHSEDKCAERGFLKSKDLMKEFKTNTKAFPHSDSYYDRILSKETQPHCKLMTIKYLQINKVDIEKIMTVKEIYLILKRTIECCND